MLNNSNIADYSHYHSDCCNSYILYKINTKNKTLIFCTIIIFNLILDLKLVVELHKQICRLQF